MREIASEMCGKRVQSPGGVRRDLDAPPPLRARFLAEDVSQHQSHREHLLSGEVALQEREELQTRYIIYGSIAVVSVVLILIIIAIVDAYFITPNKPVAVVNGDEITTTDYQTRVKFERLQLVNQFGNTLQLMQSFDDESTMQYFQSSLQQINFQLLPEMHGQNVLDTMIDDVIIHQEAEKSGIVVDDSELDEYIEGAFGYFPDGTPTPVATNQPMPTSTLSSQQQTLVPESTTVGTARTEEIDVTPTPVEPDEDAPTPTVYTEEAFQQDYNDTMQSYKQSINISEPQFREVVRSEILRNKMVDEISKDLP